ncbi:MAG: hypothetical protein B7Z26_09000 [Asticcacaulis sp. 32-58-5]|nr:MAG: hypothetical protein B7Z26_09000 [Asticcacaulis sp. 32-58-5]
MARSYVPFSNGGYKVAPHGVIRIRTTSGKILYQYREDVRTQVIANPPLSYMNQMMRQVVISGTGNGIKIPGNYDLAGKTGTTSDYRDAWFVGYTGGFTTAVWVGRDNNTPMARVTGGGTPAAIWRDFMASALTRIKVSAIPTGPVSEMGLDASAAVDELLNSSPAAEPANDNGLPPMVTMEPIPNPEEPSQPETANDIFSEAQRRNQ